MERGCKRLICNFGRFLQSGLLLSFTSFQERLLTKNLTSLFKRTAKERLKIILRRFIRIFH